MFMPLSSTLYSLTWPLNISPWRWPVIPHGSIFLLTGHSLTAQGPPSQRTGCPQKPTLPVEPNSTPVPWAGALQTEGNPSWMPLSPGEVISLSVLVQAWHFNFPQGLIFSNRNKTAAECLYTRCQSKHLMCHTIQSSHNPTQKDFIIPFHFKIEKMAHRSQNLMPGFWPMQSGSKVCNLL